MNKLQEHHQKRIIRAAVNYIKRGWAVIPVGYNKKPLVEDWPRLATHNANQLIEWWTQYPTANLGVATGKRSGFFVIDIDVKENTDGASSLVKYFGDEFEFDTRKYLAGKTPSGGIHLLFKYDENHPAKTIANVLPSVDIRGDGGQIVVAPSIRKEGDEWIEYRWNDLTFPICEPLPWVKKLITLAGEADSKPVNIKNTFYGLDKGNRDVAIHKIACLFASQDIPFEDTCIFASIFAERCKPPFDQREAIVKVQQAYKWWANESERKEQEINNNNEKAKKLLMK